MTRFATASFLVLTALGCIDNKPINESLSCPCAPGWLCDVADGNICVPTPSTPDAGPTCGAACGDPAGTVAIFTTPAEVYAKIEGRWQICSSIEWWGAPADTVGIEFGPGSAAMTAIGGTEGGLMYYLVNGPSGPVRGRGFDYQLTYDVAPEGVQNFQFDVHPTPNSGFGGSFRYSPCPEQFEMNLFFNNIPSILVRLGEGALDLPTRPDAGPDGGP